MKAITVFIFAGVVIVVLATVVILAGALFWLRPVERAETQPAEEQVVAIEPPIAPGSIQEWQREQQLLEEFIKSAASWSDEQVASKVRHVLFKVASLPEANKDIDALKSLGPRTQAAVVEILRDPTLYPQLVKPYGEERFSETPLRRACNLLGNRPPESVLEPLKPFLGDPVDSIRSTATWTVAAVGTLAAVPLVEQALNDQTDYVKSSAVSALNNKDVAKQLDEATRRALFDCVKKYVDRVEFKRQGFQTLLVLDEERATEYLVSDEVLSPQCPFLENALDVLIQERVSAPRERLLALIDQLDGADLEHPRSSQLGRAAVWLGRLQNPEDRPRLEKLVEHADRIVAENAAEGMLASHGLGGFGELWDNASVLAPSTPKKYYLAVIVMNGSVDNGGFHAYFSQSAGGDWQNALDGLKEMGFEDRLATFREVLSCFPGKKPHEDMDRRMQQIANIPDAEDRFSALNKKFRDSKERVRVYVMRYVLEHLDDFK